MNMVALPDREISELTSKGLLKKTKSSPLVAAGTHDDAKIDLYVLSYKGKKQASVFIYNS